MPAFQYEALDAHGRHQRGVIQADTARAARGMLRDRGLNALHVAGAQEANSTGASSAVFRRTSIGAPRLAMLIRQLATLTASGLPLDEALQAIAEGSDEHVRPLIVALRARVMEGASLAGAMSEHAAAFPPLFRASVEAGESAGKLDAVLHRLGDYAESREALRRRLLLAMTYPAVLVSVALLVVSGLMVWVVPQVIGVFAQQQHSLPWPTRVMLGITDMIQSHGTWLLVGLGLAVAATIAFARSARLRILRDRAILRLPLVGGLVRANETARFARTLALLVGSAVPLLEALSIATQVVTNHFLRQSLAQVGARVREGQPFSKVLANTRFFPPVAVRLIATGERSGRLDSMLGEAAASQERDLDTSVGIAMAALGPGVILVVGALVLFIVLAILLPIFELNSLIR